MSPVNDTKPYFVWDASLDTGIEPIDAQHRQIADYLNRLHQALRVRDAEEIKRILDQLVAYTLTHFGLEETLLVQAGYDKLQAHQQVHRAFAQRIRDYQARYSPENDIGRKLLSDLRIWLTDHIRREDHDYVATVQAHLKHEAKGWFGKGLDRLLGRQ